MGELIPFYYQELLLKGYLSILEKKDLSQSTLNKYLLELIQQ